MPRIGPYGVPFPFPPYALQEHAVTALRDFLEADEENEKESYHHHNYDSTTTPQQHEEKKRKKKTTKIAVLESPTGTGKSHMLLSGVLSYVFTPVDSDVVMRSDTTEKKKKKENGSCSDSEAHASSLSTAEPPSAPTGGVGSSSASASAATPVITLAEALAQQRLREEVERVRAVRKESIKMERRRLRRIEKSKQRARAMKARSSGTPKRNEEERAEEGDDEFLVQQDTTSDFADGGSAMLTEHGAMALSRAAADDDFLSSSSSSSVASLSDDSDSDQMRRDEDDVDDAQVTGVVPLRKPKIYFASRTHTQLQQLMQDLQATSFSRNPVVLTHPSFRQDRGTAVAAAHSASFSPSSSSSPVSSSDAAAATATSGAVVAASQRPHWLRAVHVAGRQQLCINAAIRSRSASTSSSSGGGGVVAGAAALNDMCLSAMQFEYSAAGRAARKRREKQKAVGVVFTSATASRSAPRATGLHTGTTTGGDGGAVHDMEDLYASADAAPGGGHVGGGSGHEDGGLDDNKGCEYCAKHRLRAFLSHVMSLSPQRDDDDDARTESDGSSRRGISLSLQEMISLGKEMRACPYLATRLLVRGADVVLIPYPYLVDEEQRNALLGGEATNPVSETEADMVEAIRRAGGKGKDDGGGENEKEDDVGEDEASGTLGVVLHRLKHRHHHPRGSASARPSSAITAASSSSLASQTVGFSGPVNHKGQVDMEMLALAHAAPPSVTGDMVVIDEAHNIADYCRSVSTSAITSTELKLTQALLQLYLHRYENRLLVKNKQKLRELIYFIGKLLDYFSSLIRKGKLSIHEKNSNSSKSTSASTDALVLSFNEFLFEADVGHVDTYPYVLFFTETRLAVKLQGFISYVLKAEAERQQQQQENSIRKGSHAASEATSATATAASTVLALLQSVDVAAGARVRATTSSTFSVLSDYSDTSSHSRYASIISVAVRSFELLLRRLYESDDATTRLIVSAAAPFSSVPSFDNTGDGSGGLVVSAKLLQLEPGKHTLYPLIKAAYATILAGGTMQPLALTCGPLLPPPPPPPQQQQLSPSPLMDNSFLSTSSFTTTSAPSVFKERGWTLGIRLISEDHVVPPSSIDVWALGTGPSGTRLEFSHRALSEGSGSERSSFSFPAAFPELACTLLNTLRVLPHASGAICFFPSYELERSFTNYLLRSGYYDRISEVVRIFREGGGVGGVGDNMDSSTGAAAASLGMCDDSAKQKRRAGSASGSTVEQMLDDYKKWIQACKSNSSSATQTKSSYGIGGIGAAGLEDAQQQQRHSSASSLSSPPSSTFSRGALLFAVMGGRLSEGINFADDLGRAVFVVGLPFANPNDVELQLYLRHVASTRLATTPSLSSASAAVVKNTNVSGSTSISPATPVEWGLYTDLCMRTVNQCIGRCIRHAKDFAVVILVDVRYAIRQDVRSRVSHWMQPSVKVASTYGECFRGVRDFFLLKKETLT